VVEYRVWRTSTTDFNHGLQPRTLVVWITPPYLSLCKTKHIFLLYCWLQYQRLVFKIFPEGPFTRAIFCCDFLLLINMNKRIKKECAECALPHRNIRHWFTPWHPSKIAAKIACVSGPFGWWTHKLYTYMQYTLNIYSIYTLYILHSTQWRKHMQFCFFSKMCYLRFHKFSLHIPENSYNGSVCCLHHWNISHRFHMENFHKDLLKKTSVDFCWIYTIAISLATLNLCLNKWVYGLHPAREIFGSMCLRPIFVKPKLELHSNLFLYTFHLANL
jgi:hypothetical protein